MFKTEVFDNKSALIARLTELAESGNWVFVDIRGKISYNRTLYDEI